MKSILCSNDLIVLHLLGILFIYFLSGKIPFHVTTPRFKLTSERQKVSRLPAEPPGRPAFKYFCTTKQILDCVRYRYCSLSLLSCFYIKHAVNHMGCTINVLLYQHSGTQHFFRFFLHTTVHVRQTSGTIHSVMSILSYVLRRGRVPVGRGFNPICSHMLTHILAFPVYKPSGMSNLNASKGFPVDTSEISFRLNPTFRQ